MYIPLHWHSTYSFLEALGSPQKIVEKAKEFWLPAIAITDYNGIYCFPPFYLAAKGVSDENYTLKAVIGVELGLVEDMNNFQFLKYIGNICLIAMTDEGYTNLREIITIANEEGLPRKPKIDFSILEKYHEGLVVFYGGIESWCYAMTLNGETYEKIKTIHEKIQSIFGENCYLEMTAQDENGIGEYKKINNIITTLAKETQTKCIVNNNYFFPEAWLRETREIALSIKDGTKLFEQHRNPQGKFYIMQEQEIREICEKNGYTPEEIQERITNNETIATNANVKIDFGQALFPVYETPEHVQKLFDAHADKMIITDEQEQTKPLPQEEIEVINKHMPKE